MYHLSKLSVIETLTGCLHQQLAKVFRPSTGLTTYVLSLFCSMCSGEVLCNNMGNILDVTECQPPLWEVIPECEPICYPGYTWEKN
jgi:hypothetical protein